MPDWPFPSLFAIIMVLIQAFSDSTASRPAGVGLSARKLRRLIPVLFPNTPYRVFRWLLGPSVAQRMVVRDILRSGDTGAAVVLSVDPLWVAVYSEDMDGAFVLQYPQEFVAEYNLTVGSRLLGVMQYEGNTITAPDVTLTAGPRRNPKMDNIIPFVAEFLSDDLDRIEAVKTLIAESEWALAEAGGRRYLEKYAGSVRNGGYWDSWLSTDQRQVEMPVELRPPTESSDPVKS